MAEPPQGLITCLEHRASLSQIISAQYNIAVFIEDAIKMLLDGRVARATCSLGVASSVNARQGDFFRKCLAPVYFNHHLRTGGPNKACKTFSVPELLEMILLKLDIADLLRIQQVCKHMHRAMDISGKILRKLHLAPDHKARLRVLPCWRPKGHENEFAGPRTILEGFVRRNIRGVNARYQRKDVLVRVTINDLQPPLGSKARRMLITQPPIHYANITTDCCVSFPDRNEILRHPEDYSHAIHTSEKALH